MNLVVMPLKKTRDYQMEDKQIGQSLNHSITHYIGVDIGTTSTKAIIFSENGEMLAQESVGYGMYHPKPNYAEQNPEEIYDAFTVCLEKIQQKLPKNAQNIGISFSSAMHSLLAIDENGKPLTPLIIWADNRASSITKELKTTDLGKEIYHRTGIPIHPYSVLSKLLWLKENESEVFEKAHKFIGIKEYIWFQLFGKYEIDRSLASGTGMFNIHTQTWDDLALKTIGINETKLSEIVSIQQTIESENQNSKLRTQNSEFRTLVFCIGAGDGPLANVGSGAMETGKMALTIGTSGAVRIRSIAAFTDPQMRSFDFVFDEHTHIIGGATNNGAVVLQWLKEDILKTNVPTEKLIEEAAQTPVGTEGLIFLPYILGERAPIYQPEAQGVFFGLHKNHSQAHFVRAVLEGIILNLYSIGKILMQKEPIEEILVSGGFAQSKVWLQILADIFQKKVVVNETIESSAWGAVLVMKGWKNNKNLTENTKKEVILPNVANKVLYQELHDKFENLYERLKTCF